MASTYRKRHSRFYISLAESILRGLRPDPPAALAKTAWTFTQDEGVRQLKQYKSVYLKYESGQTLHGNNKSRTSLDIKEGMYLLRRTAQTRKHRAFGALLEHEVFKHLPEDIKAVAGDMLAGTLDEFHATDCKVRLGEGWEKEYERLNPMRMYFPRPAGKLSWRSPLILRRGETYEEVSLLLEKLSRVDNHETTSLSRLRAALAEYLKQNRPLDGIANGAPLMNDTRTSFNVEAQT